MKFSIMTLAAFFVTLLLLASAFSLASAMIVIKPTPGAENRPAPVHINPIFEPERVNPGVDSERLQYDLTPTKLEIGIPDAPFYDGDSLYISLFYRNLGTKDLESKATPWKVSWYLDGVKVAEKKDSWAPHGNNNRGESHWEWLEYVPAGEHTLRVVLDEDDVVFESNEDNNAIELKIKVFPSKLSARVYLTETHDSYVLHVAPLYQGVAAEDVYVSAGFQGTTEAPSKSAFVTIASNNPKNRFPTTLPYNEQFGTYQVTTVSKAEVSNWKTSDIVVQLESEQERRQWKVPFTAFTRSIGSLDAPVTIEVYADYSEFFVHRWYEETYPVLRREYVDTDKVRIVFKHFPLVSFFDNGVVASAVQCAAEQGKFLEYLDEINKAKKDGTFYVRIMTLNSLAHKAGMNGKKYDSCHSVEFNMFLDSSTKSNMYKEKTEAEARFVRGSPAFFINGRVVEGAQPFDAFVTVIEEELARTPPLGSNNPTRTPPRGTNPDTKPELPQNPPTITKKQTQGMENKPAPEKVSPWTSVTPGADPDRTKGVVPLSLDSIQQDAAMPDTMQKRKSSRSRNSRTNGAPTIIAPSVDTSTTSAQSRIAQIETPSAIVLSPSPIRSTGDEPSSLLGRAWQKLLELL